MAPRSLNQLIAKVLAKIFGRSFRQRCFPEDRQPVHPLVQATAVIFRSSVQQLSEVLFSGAWAAAWLVLTVPFRFLEVCRLG